VRPRSFRFHRSLVNVLTGAVLAGTVLACARSSPPSGDQGASAKNASGSSSAAPVVDASSAAPRAANVPVPANAVRCAASGGPTCFRFPTAEDGFRWVLTHNPQVLAVGEAHAQKGTEKIASTTKRFTDAFLPILAPRASDVVVELWAPDPKCMQAVKQVASAQKVVTDVQASTNQNEYVTLGTKAKESGVTPWLLRPTCDDFSMLADAGADGIGAMLGLVKRLTQTKVGQLYEKNTKGDAGKPEAKIVVAYGGALHNDLAPPEATKDYSFGPDLDRMTGGRYVELDLIVPEFVKNTAVWEKLPWFASYKAERASSTIRDQALVFVVAERSFVLVFPGAAPPPAPEGGAPR
jgi:hypothetical protein